jgi:tRNA pseudouridine synthase 10
MDMLEKTEEILKTGCVCDHCLGRQFAKLLSGFSNDQRGNAFRTALAMQLDSSDDLKGIDASNFTGFKFHGEKLSKISSHKQKKCLVCDDFFKSLDSWVSRAVSAASRLEFKTFLVGTTLSADLLAREENLWESVGLDYCEPLKAEINREIGKRIEKALSTRADLKKPDINFIIDASRSRVSVQPNPIFFYGEYQKLARGIPQTKWPSGKFKNSIEQIVARPLMSMLRGSNHKFHGMGREDIDARCLGWRPFVIEIIEPLKRKADLIKTMKAVNKSTKVKVRKMRASDIDEVRKIKDSRARKEYCVEVLCERDVSRADLKKLSALRGEISQHTPKRVIRRRADILRKRKVLALNSKYISSRKFILTVRCDAGLYIKELVSGDSGRTKPSVSELLGCTCEPRNLDVTKIIR